MSSDIFSRPIDVSKYDIIYAGAQKNLAPAGVTLAIVRVDALGHVERPIPTMLNYKTHVDKDSMFNTPPVLPIYAALQTLKWYKEQGGVAAMERRIWKMPLSCMMKSIVTSCSEGLLQPKTVLS